MARIDLGDDDSEDALKDALRQIERQQRGAGAPEPTEEEREAKRKFEERQEAERETARGEIEGAVEAIREHRAEVERRPAPARAPSAVRWVVVGIGAAALIIAAAILLRPEPLPPPARSPREAVDRFWSSLIEGEYQAATVYYPGLVEKYGSRKQAAMFLEQYFGEDPPTNLTRVDQPEELLDSDDLRVSYEVWLRSGRPRTGEFIVRRAETLEGGYIIVTGP